MEQKIDEILKQLHRYLFADSQQIIIELKHYIIDFNHSQADLAFISSKIFNSQESLLEFLRKNLSENDKLISGIKKRLIELIIIYQEHNPQQLNSYLPQIFETCQRSFLGDQNSFVKEAALQLILKIIQNYNNDQLKAIVKPSELIQKLLNEIKHKRPSQTVRGVIWTSIGQIHKNFSIDVRSWIIESQDQMYQELKEEFQSTDPKIKTIIGILKGLSLSLEDDCTLEHDEIEGLFIRIKTAMQQIPDVKQKGVQKQAMKLFSTHVHLFKKVIPFHAESMVKLNLQLCVDQDMNLRDASNNMLGKLMSLISDGLLEDQSIHLDIFQKIVQQFRDILDDKNNNVQLISAIKAIGVFSKAIKKFSGEAVLLNYLEKLIDLSEHKLVKEFEDQKNPEDDVQNFKIILKKQKQLISYIESYSFIIQELIEEPSEKVQNHFLKICHIGIVSHRKLYEKYKHRFYDALASLVMSLSKHKHQFSQWIRKFVRKTLQETLKIPDAAIFGAESPEESLKDAIQFWQEWLNKDQLWSEYTCTMVYDELISTILDDINQVNLTYRAVNSNQQDQNSNEDNIQGIKSGNNIVQFVANNNNHQQYLKRIADFFDVFVLNCHDMWLLKWISQLSEVVIRKSLETQRIPKIYQILSTCLKVCSKYHYFKFEEKEEEQEDGEKRNLMNQLLSYFKDLSQKSEEFQDDLLLSTMDLLLNVPIDMLFNKEIGTENIEIWKNIILKALDLGHLNNYIALSSVNTLQNWFSQLPPNITVQLYKEVLPKLSDYLNIDNSNENNHDKIQYYHQRVLQQELEFGKQIISRKLISQTVLELLGKIGGYAHNIINNELSKKHDKENFIRWDSEKRLKFTLPLYTRKIDIYLDSCLPRIIDLAQNQPSKEIRIAACELLHSLIIFMIGKNAQNVQNNQVTNKKKENTSQLDQLLIEELAAFSKLYAKIFPVIIKLATDLEQVPRQLFEPLCYQIVRWFSSSKMQEHPEVEQLLDSLIEGAQNKNNTSLRNLCSNAVAEFAKWSIKQMSEVELEQNPINIKSLIRRIQSNSNHPDPYKRLSAVLCFNRVFSVIREYDPLVDRFCLEICHSIITSLKLCYEKDELSHEVIDTVKAMIPKIQKVVIKKWNLLTNQNPSRSIVPDLPTLIIYFFEKFKSHQTVYRRESIKLWENLVLNSPPNQCFQNNLKLWIRDYYCKHRSNQSILMRIQQLQFSKEKLTDLQIQASDPVRFQMNNSISRKEKIFERKKNFDTLTAQIEFMYWLLTKGHFEIGELENLHFESNQIAKNINQFLKNILQKSFDKNKDKISQKVIICKEDKESETKSKINVLIEIFNILNLFNSSILKDGLQNIQKKYLKWLKITTEDGDLINGLTNTSFELQEQIFEKNQIFKYQQYFLETAIYIMLAPQLLNIQLLVENKDLETLLRNQVQKYLENYIELMKNSQEEDSMIDVDQIVQNQFENDYILQLYKQKLCKDVKIIDLRFIKPNKQIVYSPKILMNLCVGLLQLSKMNPKFKDHLMRQINSISYEQFIQNQKKITLKDTIHLWLESDSPYENESAKILVKFASKLRISNQVILEWITKKSVIYHKTSEIILDYIAENFCITQDNTFFIEDEEDQIDQQSSQFTQSQQIIQQPIQENQVMSQIPASQHQYLQGMSQNANSQNTSIAQVNAFNQDVQYSCLGEFLISKIGQNQTILYSLFIPIVEKLNQISQEKDQNQYLKLLIEYLPIYCNKPIKHEFKDIAINQIKLLGSIAVKANKLLLQDNSESFDYGEDVEKWNKICQIYKQYMIDVICPYLKEKFSVYLKEVVFNLISFIGHIPFNSEKSSNYQKITLKETMLDKLMPSLKYVRKMHFPLKSRDLVHGTNENQNFQIIIKAFLNLLVISKNLKVLKSLYCIIREHKTSFEQSLKQNLNILITQHINLLEKQQFLSEVGDFINEFLDRKLDTNIDDNVRWAIASKIVIRVLETCLQEKLIDLFIRFNDSFLKILKMKFEDFEQDQVLYFNFVREKTYVMAFYEILYRRLSGQLIKESLHKQLYGENTSQNELTKQLIEIAVIGKRDPIQNFDQICRQEDLKDEKGNVLIKSNFKCELPEINSPKVIQNYFSCVSYSLLSSVIVCTQEKNELTFANFLFQAKQGNAQNSMWNLLVDTSFEYQFKVQTNFNHIELKNIEQKLADLEKTNSIKNDIAGMRVQNMMNEYLTSSFMSANEKFNQNMVFETQINDINLKHEEEKYIEIFNKKYNPYTKNSLYSNTLQSSTAIQKSSQSQEQIPIESLEEVDSQLSEKLNEGTFIPDQESQFELDVVNQHWCMKNIKRCIERMKFLFEEQWSKSSEMPKFAQYLLNEFKQESTHINIKIFILKIVVNNPKLFKPYASQWFEPICNYILCKKSGGKGFHYFLRDLCTMIISWDYVPESNPTNKLLLSNVINSLILISADVIKLIFKQNIKIISTLMEKWRKLIAINKSYVNKMLQMDQDQRSQLWKMNAIEIVALAVCYDIPVLNKVEDVQTLNQEQHKFTLMELGAGKQNFNDLLLNSILKIFESKKKQIIYAAAELVGMILDSQKSHNQFQIFLQTVKLAIFSNEIKERHDIFVFTVERISRQYKDLLNDRQLFLKTLGFLNVLTGTMRASVFKSLERHIEIARAANNIQDINEIALSIQAVLKDVLADINDENQQAFIQFIITISQLKGIDYVENLLDEVVQKIKVLFVHNKNEYSRALFYELMVQLYDRYSKYQNHQMVRSSLIHGLNDGSKIIRDKVAQFWNDQNRLNLDPLERLRQLMENMYVPEEENIWLTNASYFILSVSTQSSDFNRKIFNQPLQDCQFQLMHVNLNNKYENYNRSQPMTPLFTQIDMMIQASQTLQDNYQKNQNKLSAEKQSQQLSQIDSNVQNNAKRQIENKLKFNQKKNFQENQNMQIGYVRATQIPVFTQTQNFQSSLVAGIKSQIIQADSIAESFYQINQKEKQAVDQKPKEYYENQFQQRKLAKTGTQLLTINDQQDYNDMDEGLSDSQGFVAPKPIKKKGAFKKFFNRNDFLFRPMEVQDGQRIRFVHEASMPSNLSRKEEIRRVQRQQFIDKQVNERKNNVQLFRKYRIGELPDIQIDFKDVVMPLMAIVRNDQTMATEIFIEVFVEIYKEQTDRQVRQKLGIGIFHILKQSTLYDYSAINCIHRIALELLKIDQFTLDSEIIQRSGEYSLNFQTGLILLEETLIRGDMNKIIGYENKEEVAMKGKKKQVDALTLEKRQMSIANRQYWFKLIKLYEIIGNVDALHGIWSDLAQNDGIMFVHQNSQNNHVNQNEDDSDIIQELNDQEQTINLVKRAQNLSNQGMIKMALKELENTLSNEDLSQNFEISIKQELENKRYEYKSQLLKWDSIAKELNEAHKGKQVLQISEEKGFKQVELMIRSMVRSEDFWEDLTSQVKFWMQDESSKSLIEKNFSYELAMLFLTQLDYDRARIYIDKECGELLNQWKNLTKLSQVAQHFLVQKIQKIYEMNEFLNLIKDDIVVKPESFDKKIQDITISMLNWSSRIPSQNFDRLNVWDDITLGRLFFIDQYSLKIKNDCLQQSIIQNSQRLAHNVNLKSVQDIQVMLYVQTAKGAFKMGLFDTTDCYLKKAQVKSNQIQLSDMQIIVPIIKLKTEQTKYEMKNQLYESKIEKFEKIYKILVDKMDKGKSNLSSSQFKIQYDQISDFNEQLQFDKIKSVYKANILKFNLQKKLLSIVEKSESQESSKLQNYLKLCFESLSDLKDYLKPSKNAQIAIKLKQEYSNLQQSYLVEKQAKVLLKFAKFTDKILRKMDQNKDVLSNSLKSIDKNDVSLAKLTIQNCLQSLNLGCSQASDFIPRMLEVLSKYKDNVKQEFIEFSQDTPSWLFLRWISQISSVINKPESSILQNLVLQIAQKYPQAVFYPFKVIESLFQLNFLDQTKNIQESFLFQTLRSNFAKFTMLNQWAEALDCLIFPEHRFRYWYQIFIDTYQSPEMQVFIQKPSNQNNQLLAKMRLIVVQMFNDIIRQSKPLVEDKIGLYNKQFCKKWAPVFNQSFGNEGASVQQMTINQLLTEISNINKKIQTQQLFQGKEILQKYSEWMDEFDCNEFYKVKKYIDIPGQYENQKFSQEPQMQKNIKIASFKKICLVLGSIRRPKKVTIHGNNEKDYQLLIKGGEDLRLDQRVQQLFSIMNSVFQVDPQCENRGLNLKTFKVIPISNRLGSLEWVDNTEPMKAIISKEHKRLEQGKDLHESRAYVQRMQWLKNLPENKNQKNTNAAQLHLGLLMQNEENVVQAFENHQRSFPHFLLRSGLENICLTSSAFLTIKNHFIKSMAVFSIASYLIGVGDRHLENFLVDITDGEVLGIDFGIAFGSNINLSIPELIPFRMTLQIEGVIAPHPLEGIYKQAMVHALSAIRKKKSLILDTCEIFVKEPLLDWYKDAKQRNKTDLQESNSDMQQDMNSVTQNESLLSWYPRQKIQIVKDKLMGVNPVKILRMELKDSQHYKRAEYINQLRLAINGPQDSLRQVHLSSRKQFLQVEDQIDILIELARDPNILGRTWIGWSPYI